MAEFPTMASDGSDVNISDVIAAITKADPNFDADSVQIVDLDDMANGLRSQAQQIPQPMVVQQQQQQQQQQPQPQMGVPQQQTHRSQQNPYVEIVEQPASKALRFRYECEGRSAGSIPGVNSTPENKTFPTIRIVGARRPAIVVVSCVTKDPPYRAHPHNLVGKEVCKKGVCRVKLSADNMTVSFDKLGIQCVKRKDIEEALNVREAEQVDPFRNGFDHKRQPTSIDLNAVRLAFQVFLEGPKPGQFKICLDSVVSEPIYDKKANSDLVICKLSHCTAPVTGGTEMVLLCEKVSKEDIQVRFFEEVNGQVLWEGFGEFQPNAVHKQVAISFRTPSYRNQDIEGPVKAFIQLRRPSDGATSEALQFMFSNGRPDHHLWSLRKVLARKKVICDLNRVLANDALLPPRTLDDYNNNGDGSDIDMLNARRAYNRLVALRALNDIYNVENRDSRVPLKSGLSDSAREVENNNVETICDDDKTIVPETNGSVREENINGNVVDNKTRTEWLNYTQVGKWVEKNQATRRGILEEDNNELNDDSMNNGDKEFNELMSDVVELDKIYEDTHAKLIQERQQNKNNSNSMDLDVHDNRTYTSLQMAMKNPVWVRARKPQDKASTPIIIQSPIIAINPDVPPPRPPPLGTRIKRDVDPDSEERLPPLPPKRIRKTPSMPVLPRPNSQIFIEQQQQAPQKNLPTLPSATLPKQNKPGIFSKIFSKKPKKENTTSTISLPGLDKDNSQLIADKLPPVRALATSTKSLELDGNATPPYGADLTEAEHYALYTAMAPHATASEFDEMSFYYSPVEGGKILAEGRQAA